MPAKQLIQWGWDEPTPAFMREHWQAMEETPFSGCVFGVPDLTWRFWSHWAVPESSIRPSLDHLLGIPWQRFKNNFLRLNVTPGDVDLSGDWSAIVSNATAAARLAREAGARGICLDTEPYEGGVWFRLPAGQRWEEAAIWATNRGRLLMETFQREFPGLTIFLSHGWSKPYLDTLWGSRPLWVSRYGLLAYFLNGMLAAAGPRVTIIDGHEVAYGFQLPGQFAQMMQREEELPAFVGDAGWRWQVKAAYPVWLDYEWRSYGWSTEDVERNFYSPSDFEVAVGAALKVADEFVWIYNETPRWWPEREKLPAVYEAVLRKFGEGER